MIASKGFHVSSSRVRENLLLRNSKPLVANVGLWNEELKLDQDVQFKIKSGRPGSQWDEPNVVAFRRGKFLSFPVFGIF
ncbi:hypothetical protein [Bradyrhizobium iriomotense]|uniref:Uncharacterized protein n=1 Tax=Bradyrhizobium iriomotense TaxID=441950 RepID=A0ABQ6BAU5_9BRAD|nr:hypothetical protein [Bradyrhizobium iriomotense]GLR90971.1 hypothetical protein GCM10007857_76870 [Bradyrhizobium iriomotense]